MDAARGLGMALPAVPGAETAVRRYLVHNSMFCLLLAREVVQKKGPALFR